jgi:apolipoprotein N-acyltransferase
MKMTWKDVLLLLASVLLTGLAFAPMNQSYTAFFSLLPLFYVLEKNKNGFLTGLVWGLFYCVFSIHWLAFNSGTHAWLATLSMFLAAGVLALNYGVIGMLYKIIQRKNRSYAFLLLPFIWVAVEFLRSFGTLGFPWLALGHSQAYNTLYIQQADIGGVYTVSFMLLLTNIILFRLLRSFSWKRFAALGAVLLIPFLYGIVIFNVPMHAPEKLHFRVIQPNVGAKEKWEPANRIPIINKMDSLSRVETEIRPDVIIWPETAVPYYLRSSVYISHILTRCAAETRSTLITGSLDFFYTDTLGGYGSTNSIFVFEPHHAAFRADIYDKIHLVPFGEYTPGGKWLKWLNNMQYGQSDFKTRKNREVPRITKDNIPVTPIICYDSVFPHTVRRFAAEGKSKYNILVTNDIWFGRSMGPHQHAAIAIVRAVETRKPLARSANAGISMFIDEKGRVLGSLPLYTTGILDRTLYAARYEPLYVRAGNWFGVTMVIISLAGIILSLWHIRKK